jgi:hypothetical protein
MAHPPTTRYIVLKWMQAGSQPTLASSDLFAKLIDADDLARDMTADAKSDDRGDTHTVHEVNMDVVTY